MLEIWFKRLHLVNSKTQGKLRKKAPQIIFIAIAIAIIVYIVLSILEDVVIEGGPITGGPVIGAIISITENVTQTIKSWGYYGIFGLMLLESSSLPVPSELILPFAGFLVSQGILNFWIVTFVATVAAIIGSLIDYYIGLKGVEALTKYKILGRTLFSMDQLTFAAKWFNKYGAPMIFIARLVPGLRTLISFPAGAAKMKLSKFIVYTTAGCLLWNGLLIYLGWFLGQNWQEVAGITHYLIIATVATMVLVIAAFIIRRKRKNAINKVTQHSTELN
jgi:membrane protein DedA with SNARE-associated domain